MATGSKSSKKRLFEDDDEEDEPTLQTSGKAKLSDNDSSFTINEEYARRFEHNKKREERHRLEEKYGKEAANKQTDSDSESSDDESEDEGGYLLTEELDARMSEALQAIKNKDPRIYDTETKFFDPSEIDQAAETAKATASTANKSKDKPLYLMDYHRERYLRGDIGAEDDDEDDDEAGGAPVPQTYQQEQDEIKRALIAEMNAADTEGDIKVVEKKADEDDDDDDEDGIDSFIKPKASSKASKAAAAKQGGGMHPSRAQRVRITEADVKRADENPNLFLSNFLASRAWVPEEGDQDGMKWQAFESDDDDDAERDRAEAFEAAYNLRFEDPDKSNEVLKSYSRTVVAERSVRREAQTARQRQRAAEQARQEAEKQERREERARLRKLHIEEAQTKLAQIKQAAGLRGKVTLSEAQWEKLLEGAWDNDTWEAEMQKQFGEEYYAEADAEIGAALEEDDESESASKKKKPKKPKWDDDIDIKDIVPEFDDADLTVSLSDAEAAKGGEEEDEEDEEENDDDNSDDGEQPSSKRRKTAKDRKQERAEAKRQARRERARIEALVDRQMVLEDAGESSTAAAATNNSTSSRGFRYRETSPQAFGLTARDILLAPSDAALNEFAGLKKLATFRDEERKRKDRKKLGKKARLRQWRRDTFGAAYEHTGPTYGFERLAGAGPAAAAAAAAEDGEGQTDKSHDKKKRKRSGRKGKGKEDKSKGKAAAAA